VTRAKTAGEIHSFYKPERGHRYEVKRGGKRGEWGGGSRESKVCFGRQEREEVAREKILEKTYGAEKQNTSFSKMGFSCLSSLGGRTSLVVRPRKLKKPPPPPCPHKTLPIRENCWKESK